ncbi:hypothetical protein I7I53_06169 [Histoplasma capsulatum var. duboisii H88]|uniref:DDE-1 domain-containing protein n=1 Tax=Ajellomyces capsulatus (strain H88) TaxID=544711 RepID=A0A8A1LGR5_AJEC8|nr:hypothetical protein I7I53_06169 [Histoplasma capsulatum var. duboisii H88]
MWIYRFIEHLPEYKRVKQKPMDPKRLAVENIGYINTWFEHLWILFKQYRFQTCNVYNFNEIGFQEGQGRGEWVITAFKEANSIIPSSFSKGLITVIECVSMNNHVIPPLIILASKSHLKDWYTQTDLPSNYKIAISDTGFTNDEIGFE